MPIITSISISLLLSTFPAICVAEQVIPSDLTAKVILDTAKEPIIAGPYEPTWKSLEKYQVPDWYRDAKFGIWAHWGPQCQPEDGDWYSRGMYVEGSEQYKSHLAKYYHPSESGFKDVIHSWKAEKWDPEKLVSLYKRTGAQGFNEGKGQAFTPEDVRFTTKGDVLYAIEQLGTTDRIFWNQGEDALTIEPSSAKPATDAGIVYKISFL